MSESHRITDPQDALGYILAGNATLTLVSAKSGARFTYKVKKAKEERGSAFDFQAPLDADTRPWFVSLLNGPDNVGDYAYLGILKATAPGMIHTRKSCASERAPSFVAFDWAIRQLRAGRLPDALEVWHEGRCGRCGRRLTVPESVASGIGPECATKGAL